MNTPGPFNWIERRRLLWRLCLSELPPDERERILAEPSGAEALSLAVTVELLLRDEPEALARQFEALREALFNST